MKAVFSPTRKENTTRGRPTTTQNTDLAEQENPVFHVFAQAISLNKLAYFGIGPATSETARSYFGMRETILAPM